MLPNKNSYLLKQTSRLGLKKVLKTSQSIEAATSKQVSYMEEHPWTQQITLAVAHPTTQAD